MKNLLKISALIALMLFSICENTWAVEPTESQKALFVERANAIQNGNLDAMLATYHSDYRNQDPGLQQLLKARLASVKIDSAQMEITEVIHPGDPSLIRVQQLFRGTQDGKPFDKSREYIYMLKNENGKSRVIQEMSSLSGNGYDEKTSSYVSSKGGFAMQLPEGWIPTHASDSMASIIIDGVSAISTDLGGSMFVGVVQLPMNLAPGEAAKLAAQTDAASMKALSTSYRIINEGSTELEGMAGWNIVSEFELHGEKYKRSQMYYENDSLIYFIISDLFRVDQMDNELELRLSFTDSVKSFRLVSIDDSLSIADQIRSDLGQGKIMGSIYTNDEFQCYIAAPKGWSLRTSSTPSTLVEMQKDGGRSIIRLMAEDNIPSTISTEQAFRGRLGQVKSMVQNFQEQPAQQVSLAGEKVWMSEQTYTIDEFGDFNVKEATLIRDGKYYLILCQSISPDSYEELEADFDKAISSFGFTK